METKHLNKDKANKVYDLLVSIGGANEDDRGDYKFAETYLNLRFGYWNSIDTKMLEKALDGRCKVELDMKVYDDDCGWKYSYKLS